MNASHLQLLWLYSVCAIMVSGIGALTLLAVFGTPGMLGVTLVFIGMAVPTAGATTPLRGFARIGKPRHTHQQRETDRFIFWPKRVNLTV